jgi:hypothetical protein
MERRGGFCMGNVMEGGYGGWTSTGAILVLFILLVIITKSFWV